MQRSSFVAPGPRRLILQLLVVVSLPALSSCDQVSQQPGAGAKKEPAKTESAKTESNASTGPESEPQQATQQRAIAKEADRYIQARTNMVRQDLAGRDIVNQRVLDVMGRVPRHEFVPPSLREIAYRDSPLPIGAGQTISQPYIVALMTQLVDPKPEHKALDIGTGSGYQAAVLAELVERVFSIEIVESLATEARQRLKNLGYTNVDVRHGDGYAGWPSEAPFDVIIVAAAPDHVPPALVEQLAPGGKLVIPVGDRLQSLVLIEKQQDGSTTRREVAPVAFVPMTGEAEK